MKILKGIKKFIYKWDFFCSTELLRYKKQDQYRTLLGGIMSMIIVIGLTLTFYNKLIDTFSKVLISSTSNNINAVDPTPFNLSTYPGKKFMFGVQVFGIDLNAEYRLFDIVLQSSYYDRKEKKSINKQFRLQPCTLDHWSDFPEIQKDFDKLYMNQWLCLPRNSQFTIRGKFSSQQYQMLTVSVYQCSDQWDPSKPCLSQDDIDYYFYQSGNMFFTIYFTNPLINPTSQEHLKYYLEDNNYIIFTQKLGATGYLFVEQFNITTDESLLPFEETRQEKGGIIREFAVKNPFEADYSYCSFTFVKSGNGQSYERKFMKIDEILSYIGGLIGIIVACLFIINDFNSSSYLIQLGSVLFNTKGKMSNKKMKNYNFLDFLVLIFYEILELLRIPPNWKTIKNYGQCQGEIQKQLDVVYLLKRVIFLERALNFLLDKHHLIGLHLQQKLTLEEAKSLRKKFMMKNKMFKSLKDVQKKQTLNSQSNINEMSQKVILERKAPDFLFLNGQKIKTQQFNMSNNQNILASQSISDINIKINKQQKNSDDVEIQSESSSSDDQLSNEEEVVAEEIKKLKDSKQLGLILSQKIWQRIDPRLKDNYEVFQKKASGSSNLQLPQILFTPVINPNRMRRQQLEPIIRDSENNQNQGSNITIKRALKYLQNNEDEKIGSNNQGDSYFSPRKREEM